MPNDEVRAMSAGANQRGLRDHNARLILSLIQRHRALPGSEIARGTGLSPQTVSVILRQLEQDGLLGKGEPIRGVVGKPRVPMALAPEGVLSFGANIGRRTSEVVCTDFIGRIRGRRRLSYRYPMPDPVLGFLRSALADLTDAEPQALRGRIAGLGIAKPFELWNWHASVGAPEGDLAAWRDLDLAGEVSRFTDLPVFVANDATSACRAEQVWGRGRELRDWAYIYLGAFPGGGVVLNDTVYEGPNGNAGSFGSLPSPGPGGSMATLIDTAALGLLEEDILRGGGDPHRLWEDRSDWSHAQDAVDRWTGAAGRAVADAARTISAVLDIEALVLDGAIPVPVRQALIEIATDELPKLDFQGLVPPRIEAGTCGPDARALGAAMGPIQAQFLLGSSRRAAAG